MLSPLGGEKCGLVIQAAFFWTNSHLHNLVKDAKIYSDPRGMDGAPELDENRFSVDGVIGERENTLLHTYDFGDDWQHEITVESREPASPADMTPACLAGKRASPPEDCGKPLR